MRLAALTVGCAGPHGCLSAQTITKAFSLLEFPGEALLGNDSTILALSGDDQQAPQAPRRPPPTSIQGISSPASLPRQGGSVMGPAHMACYFPRDLERRLRKTSWNQQEMPRRGGSAPNWCRPLSWETEAGVRRSRNWALFPFMPQGFPYPVL